MILSMGNSNFQNWPVSIICGCISNDAHIEFEYRENELWLTVTFNDYQSREREITVILDDDTFNDLKLWIKENDNE